CVEKLTRDGKLVTAVRRAPSKIVIQKATYGPPGDAARTRNVTDRVRQQIEQGNYSFHVAVMAQGDDPAVGVVKTLTVEYTTNGVPQTASATDPQTIQILDASLNDGNMPDADIHCDGDGRLWVEARKPGKYEVKTTSGKIAQIDVAHLPKPYELTGPWQLRFPLESDKAKNIILGKLASWAEHSDAEVKYFSGTATYIKKFQLPQGMIGKGRRIRLDLGRVAVIAQVKLNGKDLGILWKPPFGIDVTDTLQPGENSLEVRVTNLWVNRLIGDEQLPPDCEWGPPNKRGGRPIAKWPQWLLDGKPNPTGRHTFATWQHWNKDAALLESGLLGPVRLVAAERIRVEF
ncbi:MAG: hypothetical protein JXM70_17115, partial [Pirellulales bacterium]|nr:hypothetical protein [Pirellulales bacterium]